MKKHINIVVRGRVQGVFFRASAKEQADLLKVRGMVRNEADGSVYIEAEGDEHTLEKFIAWCHEGPPRAHVDSCQVSEGIYVGHTDFKINRSTA